MSRLISAVRGMFSLMFVLIPLAFTSAQVHKPVKWSFVAVPGKGSEATLMITATLEDGWHIYSQYIEEGGPLPTTISFSSSKEYTRVDKVKEEGMAIKSYDKTFMMDIVWYGHSVVFSQKVKLHVPMTTIQGKVEFMVCTEEMCLPPEVVSFNLEVKADKPDKRGAIRETEPVGQVVPAASPIRHDDMEPPAVTPTETAHAAAPDPRQEPAFPSLVGADDKKDITSPDGAPSSSLWGIFIAGFPGRPGCHLHAVHLSDAAVYGGVFYQAQRRPEGRCAHRDPLWHFHHCTLRGCGHGRVLETLGNKQMVEAHRWSTGA